jgi:hypothetical protein
MKIFIMLIALLAVTASAIPVEARSSYHHHKA